MSNTISQRRVKETGTAGESKRETGRTGTAARHGQFACARKRDDEGQVDRGRSTGNQIQIGRLQSETDDYVQRRRQEKKSERRKMRIKKKKYDRGE